MRTIKDILVESKKTYEFKIGVAGEVNKEQADHLKTYLNKFGLVKLSPGKKTPIQEKPLDFPNLQATEVTYFSAVVEYPTTPNIIQEYLGSMCSIPSTHIFVRNVNDPINDFEINDPDSKYEPLLTSEESSCHSGQELVGTNRVMELLKELEKAKKEE